MLRNRRLSLLLAICVTIFGLSRIAAQDATPISPPTETSVPMLPPTEIPTDVPSATPLPTFTLTLTPTPLPTETPTLLPTPTASHTATETPTETPTLQASALPTETVTATPSASDTAIPSLIPSIGTATPTSTLAANNRKSQVVAAIASAGVRYRYAPDVASLQTFVAEANANFTYRYVIWLTASNYDVAVSFGYMPLAFLYIQGDVVIVRDEAQPAATITKTGGEGYRLFDVVGRLLLVNVAVSGFQGSTGTGGAIQNEGEVYIYKSTFSNNTGTNGGAIENVKTLGIWNSVFQSNTTGGGGGALNNDQALPVKGIITVQCTTFQNNVAGSGGAINGYLGNTITVHQSNFVGNNATVSTISKAIYNTATQPNVNATGNWWGAASGPYASTNTSGTGDSVTDNVNFSSYVTGGLININNATACPRPPEAVIPAETIPPTATFTPTPSPTPVAGANMQIESVRLPKPPDDQLQNAMNLLDTVALTNKTPYAIVPASYGSCNSNAKPVCAQYSYLMFYALIYKYTNTTPTLWDMFSSIYNRELGEFGFNRIALEALSRNFFDSQTGGCPYNSMTNQYNCAYSFVTNWLGQTFWMADVRDVSGGVQVNVINLFGDQTVISEIIRKAAPIAQWRLFTNVKLGIFAYDGFVFSGDRSSASDSTNGINTDLIAKNWRTGQGVGVPSRWGNKVLLPPTTNSYTLLAGEYPPALMRHVYFYPNAQDPNRATYVTKDSDLVYGDSNGERVQGAPSGTQLTPPNCTYVAVVTTSNAGFTTQFCQ